MIYQYNEKLKIQDGTKVWACAYCLNKTNTELYLRCEPVFGVIKDISPYRKLFFPLKKNGELKNKGIGLDARDFADTYEECVDLYNEKVQNVSNILTGNIERINKLLEKVNGGFIKN